ALVGLLRPLLSFRGHSIPPVSISVSGTRVALRHALGRRGRSGSVRKRARAPARDGRLGGDARRAGTARLGGIVVGRGVTPAALVARVGALVHALGAASEGAVARDRSIAGGRLRPRGVRAQRRRLGGRQRARE